MCYSCSELKRNKKSTKMDFREVDTEMVEEDDEDYAVFLGTKPSSTAYVGKRSGDETLQFRHQAKLPKVGGTPASSGTPITTPRAPGSNPKKESTAKANLSPVMGRKVDDIRCFPKYSQDGVQKFHVSSNMVKKEDVYQCLKEQGHMSFGGSENLSKACQGLLQGFLCSGDHKVEALTDRDIIAHGYSTCSELNVEDYSVDSLMCAEPFQLAFSFVLHEACLMFEKANGFTPDMEHNVKAQFVAKARNSQATDGFPGMYSPFWESQRVIFALTEHCEFPKLLQYGYGRTGDRIQMLSEDGCRKLPSAQGAKTFRRLQVLGEEHGSFMDLLHAPSEEKVSCGTALYLVGDVVQMATADRREMLQYDEKQERCQHKDPIFPQVFFEICFAGREKQDPEKPRLTFDPPKLVTHLQDLQNNLRDSPDVQKLKKYGEEVSAFCAAHVPEGNEELLKAVYRQHLEKYSGAMEDYTFDKFQHDVEEDRANGESSQEAKVSAYSYFD